MSTGTTGLRRDQVGMSSAQSGVSGAQSRVSSVRTGKKRAHGRASSAHNGVSTGTARTSGAQSRVHAGSDGILINEQEESKRATEGLPGLGALYSLLVGQALGQAVSFLT